MINRFINFVALLSLTTSVWAAEIPSTIPDGLIYPNDKYEPGQVYGRVRFELERLGLDYQEEWLAKLVQRLFGIKQDTEYIVALQLKDENKSGDDKLVVSKILAQFIRKKDGATIFSRKVDVLNRIVLSGELVKDIVIGNSTNQFQVELVIFKSNNPVLTDDALLNKVEEFNKHSAFLHFTPIDAAAFPLYQSLRKLAYDGYKLITGNTSEALITETSMSFARLNQTKPFPREITFYAVYNPKKPIKTDDNGRPLKGEGNNAVAVTARLETYHSNIANYDEKQKKFANPIWSNYARQIKVGPKKEELTTFLVSQKDPVKSFVEGLVAEKKPQETKDDGKKVDKFKASVLCTQVNDALAPYFSTPDVAASYWIFLNLFADQLATYADGTICYSKYAQQLTSFGLPAVSITPRAQPTPPAPKGEPPKTDPVAKASKQLQAAAKKGTISPADMRRLLGIVASQECASC